MHLMDLEGVKAKVKRATVNLRNLEGDIDEFREREQRRLIAEIERGSPIVVGSDPPELLVDHSIRVGEIAYNLRSALDHLVWQLVRHNQEAPTRQNEFPIFICERRYQEEKKRKLRGVGLASASAIESLQPYHSHSTAGTHLWMLHLICNIDKHRHVNVVNLHSTATAHLRDDSVPTTLTHGMKSGLALLEYLKGTGYEDRVEIEVETDVCFRDKELEEASPGYGSRIESEGINRPPVVPVLSSCLKAVNEVVAMLTKDATGREWLDESDANL